MKLLERVSLIKINIFSSILACTLLAVFAAILIYKEYQVLERGQRDLEILHLMQTLDSVAHNHAVERGLTAGYLGNPNADNKAKVDKQRAAADLAASNLQQLSSKLAGPYPRLDRATRQVLEELKGKANIRNQVDNNEGGQAFTYYSSVNRLALDTISALIAEFSNVEVTQSLRKNLLLGRYKERAGQLRGKVNGELAKKEVTPAERLEVISYAKDSGRIADSLLVQLTGEELRSVEAILNGATTQKINATIAELIGPEPNFGELPAPAEWFSLATEQIGAIKQLIDASWRKVDQQLEDNLTSLKTGVAIYGAVILIVLLLMITISVAFTSLLRRSLLQLSTALNEIAEERDLTKKLELSGKNELTDIGGNVQHMLGSMKNTLRELIDAVSASSEMSAELGQSSHQLLSNAKESQNVATSISSAIEENAATSTEIAGSAARTLDAVHEMTSASRKNSERFSQTNQMMSSLQQSAGQIETLSQTLDRQVQEITGSVDVINSLFEQTNLLALNASIEAARAGEHGRGFAVVADEVRSLAMKSLESSERITEVLKSLQQASAAISASAVENGDLNRKTSEVMQEVQLSMEEMSEIMSNLEAMATTVATASEEQSSVSALIAQDSATVLESSHSSLNLSERLSQMSDLYRESGERMLELARKFKV